MLHSFYIAVTCAFFCLCLALPLIDAKEARSWALHLALSVSASVLSLLILEVLIRIGAFHPTPFWAPHKDVIHNAFINGEFSKVAKGNRFLFRDVDRPPEPDRNVFRIAVIGDSFVWGDGNPHEDRWSVKLEKKLHSLSSSIQVLHWGRAGWSTIDQYNFLREHGILFQPDLVVLGFVINDPNFSDRAFHELTWQHHEALAPIRSLFPEAFRFLSSFINAFVEQHSTSYGYSNWLKSLYQEENLHRYQTLLQDFAQLCKDNGIPVLAVFTPESTSPLIPELFAKVHPVFEKAGLRVLDLYPKVYEAFKDVPQHTLAANPANFHPGVLLNELYAEETARFLLENRLVPTSAAEALRR